MRDCRGFARFVLFAALASWPASANAQLFVASTPGDSPAVSHAELAYARGAGAPVTWLSLRVERGAVAVVAALAEEVVAEPALDAWLAALERTASPNVLLPTGANGCHEGLRFVHVSWARGRSAVETALMLTSSDDVLAALHEQGLALDEALPEAPRYLLWSWPEASTAQTTRTLRIVGGSAPLALTPGAEFPVLVSALTRGAEALPRELRDDELRVTFVAGQNASSDYQERLRDWVAGRAEPLVEMRARGPIFDWSIYEDQISVVPLARSYALGAADELPQLDVDACTDQLRALRDPEAPSATACAEARDAELALRAVGDDQVTLQRFALSGRLGLQPETVHGGGDASAPLLRAERWDGTQCESDPGPVAEKPPSVRGGGSSDSGASSGSTTVVVEKTVYVDETPPAEVSCGSSTPSEQGYDASDRDDSCSSDSSPSSSTDDGCASDTSSSSSGDEGCASDTSSRSSSSDDSCSSDSSSSSSDDGSCNGSSDSGYDGDTCTGSAAPGGERSSKSQASLGRARPRRLKTSLWTVGFAAALLPIRRRKRRLSSGG